MKPAISKARFPGRVILRKTYVSPAAKHAVYAAATPRVRDAMGDPSRLTSFQQKVGTRDESGDGLTFEEVYSPDDVDDARPVLSGEAREHLRLALKPREAEVLLARLDGDSRAEIGKRLGLSRERVRQIEKEAIFRARADFLNPQITRPEPFDYKPDGKVQRNPFLMEKFHIEGLRLGWREPGESVHLYPSSLGKIYPPQDKIAVTAENAGALRAAEKRYPLPINPRAYTDIGDDLPKLARRMSWTEFHRICGEREEMLKRAGNIVDDPTRYICVATFKPFHMRAPLKLRRIAA